MCERSAGWDGAVSQCPVAVCAVLCCEPAWCCAAQCCVANCCMLCCVSVAESHVRLVPPPRLWSQQVLPPSPHTHTPPEPGASGESPPPTHSPGRVWSPVPHVQNPGLWDWGWRGWKCCAGPLNTPQKLPPLTFDSSRGAKNTPHVTSWREPGLWAAPPRELRVRAPPRSHPPAPPVAVPQGTQAASGGGI